MMEWNKCNRLLRNWILILVACTLAGIIIDIVFSGKERRGEISSDIESINLTEKYLSEGKTKRSVFDSEHLKTGGIDSLRPVELIDSPIAPLPAVEKGDTQDSIRDILIEIMKYYGQSTAKA